MLKIAWSKVFAHPLPVEHRFPMIKYDLIPEQLLYEGIITNADLFEPIAIEEVDIILTHDQSYWHSLKNLLLSPAEERRSGFPHSKELILRERIIMNGTLQSAMFAIQYGVSFNVAGGTHHAFVDRGEGFCLLNVIAISANYLIKNKLSKKILIVDLDVHQGNGTASIFKNEFRVFTFSMHGEKNYPLQKEQSDLDIELPDFTDDEYYLKTLKNTLPRLIDQVQPDFVFYQSGVDVLQTDKLGRLALSIAGCKARDKFVLEECKRHKLPLSISMGGGYSPKISDIVEAHVNTFKLARDIWF